MLKLEEEEDAQIDCVLTQATIASPIRSAIEESSDLPINQKKMNKPRQERTVMNTQITEENNTSNEKSGRRRTTQHERLRHLLRKNRRSENKNNSFQTGNMGSGDASYKPIQFQAESIQDE